MSCTSLFQLGHITSILRVIDHDLQTEKYIFAEYRTFYSEGNSYETRLLKKSIDCLTLGERTCMAQRIFKPFSTEYKMLCISTHTETKAVRNRQSAPDVKSDRVYKYHKDVTVHASFGINVMILFCSLCARQCFSNQMKVDHVNMQMMASIRKTSHSCKKNEKKKINKKNLINVVTFQFSYLFKNYRQQNDAIKPSLHMYKISIMK